MMKGRFLCVMAMLIFAAGVFGQQKPATAANTVATGSPSAGALKAAEEMMISSGGSAQYDTAMDASILQLSLQAPDDKRAAFVSAVRGFMHKYCSWEALKADICMMYAREFTEAELKQLAAFYKSPVGVKLLQKSPLITQTGMLLGQKAVAEHKDELDKLLAEVMK